MIAHAMRCRSSSETGFERESGVERLCRTHTHTHRKQEIETRLSQSCALGASPKDAEVVVDVQLQTAFQMYVCYACGGRK